MLFNKNVQNCILNLVSFSLMEEDSGLDWHDVCVGCIHTSSEFDISIQTKITF